MAVNHWVAGSSPARGASSDEGSGLRGPAPCDSGRHGGAQRHGFRLSFSLEVFGQVAIPRPDEIAQQTVTLARVGAPSIWRKGFVEAKSGDFVAAGRDPTEEEWARLDAEVDEIHGAIQTACAAPA